MRIVDIKEVTVPISRYDDPSLPSGGLDTSMVAVVTDVIRDGRPVVGYGFSSVGRFAQGGLIRDRFAPRLAAARPADLLDAAEANFDPFKAWRVMMTGEKPGGHGERCVAVGTLDMALWDAAAKIAGLPLYRLLADRTGNPGRTEVPVYAGGGYYYPKDDVSRLSDEIRRLSDLGYVKAKIKIGSATLAQDLLRIDAAARQIGGPANLAVDAIYSYGPTTSLEIAAELASLGLWWFEDICDPLDFATLAAVATSYAGPIAWGEALFSAEEAALLDRHGGLRPDRDIMLFDPVHCYGVPGYLRIIQHLETRGWARSAFWPHGGHLFCLHLAAALGLGGAEVNPLCFQPFGGYQDGAIIRPGIAVPPDALGIGFDTRPALRDLLATIL